MLVKKKVKKLVLIIMNYLMVFLCGALSFALQLLATKILMPEYGGSASVWIGSLLFFQSFLFLSYYLSFNLIKTNPQKLMIFGLVSLIINSLGLFNNWMIVVPEYPILSLVGTLAVQFGLIYMTLLMFSPYLQAKTEHNFFKYYVASNGGALSGLLLYPLVVEPFMGLYLQKIGLLLGYGVIFFWFCATQHSAQSVEVEKVKANRGEIIFLSAMGTIFLGSFSSYLIQDVVSFPLLWVMPLVIYLLSFMVAFSENEKVLKFIPKNKIEILEITCLFLLTGMKLSNPWLNILVFLAVFGLIILITQVKLKEQFIGTSKESTHFYYLVALGGLIGGVIVNLIIPLVFVHVSEYVFFTIGFLAYLIWQKQPRHKIKMISFAIIVLIALCSAYYKSTFIMEAKRGFYGLIRIAQVEDQRIMYHGNIVHGIEDQTKLGEPSVYYQSKMVKHFFSHKPKKIALIGLGAGVLMHYITDPNVEVDVYEIDPHVIDMAVKHFTFLSTTPARVRFVLGDGRKEISKTKIKYDLIMVDAFSGDSIPAHLLTHEAFKIYAQRVAKNGKVGVHISNNYINLAPVVEQTAPTAGFRVLVETVRQGKAITTWATLTPGAPIKINNSSYLWTDDFNSLLKIIK